MVSGYWGYRTNNCGRDPAAMCRRSRNLRARGNSVAKNPKNEKQYEALKDKGMSKQRAAKIANTSDASSKGGKKSGSGSDSSQGGTSAQKKKAGSKGGKAASKKNS